jgi:periplasmic mercuric ion binding protein
MQAHFCFVRPGILALKGQFLLVRYIATNMKNLLLPAAFVLALSFGAADASAVVVTDTISVPEIQCGMCESRIEKSLKKSAFVTDVTADAENDVVVVSYDNTKAKRIDIEKLIAATGYATTKVDADEAAQNALHGCCKPGAHEEPETPKKKQVRKAAPGGH